MVKNPHRWSSRSDVTDAVRREWDSGRLLRACVAGDPTANHKATAFPFRVKLRHPTSRALTTDFDAARTWASGITSEFRAQVETAITPNRVLGPQEIPVAVLFENAGDMLTLIGKTRAAAAFADLTASTPAEFRPAMDAHPLQVLSAAEDWSGIVASAQWISSHPDPGIYLRQVDIPGVHSKILERQKRLICILVDSIRPNDPPPQRTRGRGKHWFEERFGFRTRPALLRLRQLDPDHRVLGAFSDTTVDVTELAQVDVAVEQVFVTENEINFLTFPQVPRSLVIFGSGNEAPETLSRLPWLADTAVYYWGDIDTHGFTILNRVRSLLPHTRSMLMDTDTLLAHRNSWVEERTQSRRDLPWLTDAEATLYGSLLSDSYGRKVRLEQEFITYPRVLRAVADRTM